MRSVAEESKKQDGPAAAHRTGVGYRRGAGQVLPPWSRCLRRPASSTACAPDYEAGLGSDGVVYFKSDYATLLAFTLLLGCLYISIGLLISSLTENQIIAAVATVGVLVLLSTCGTGF